MPHQFNSWEFILKKWSQMRAVPMKVIFAELWKGSQTAFSELCDSYCQDFSKRIDKSVNLSVCYLRWYQILKNIAWILING